MSAGCIAQRSLSDQTASALRVAQRSQSIPIPIPIPIRKKLTKGAVAYLRSDEVGSKTLSGRRIAKAVQP